MLKGEGRIIDAVGDERTVDEIPVNEECPLQGIDDGTLQTQHGVAPLVGHVALGDVHASDISHRSVEDDDFTVVAVVDLTGECGEMYGQVGLHVDTLLAHPFEEPSADAPAPYVVVDDAHLDTLMGFVDECVGNEVAQRVFLKDVYVDVDMMLCLANVGQQFREEGVAVGHDVDASHLEGQREILVDEQVAELFVALGHV